jgi:nicotinic acid mononucleotide adenylyltransferase
MGEYQKKYGKIVRRIVMPPIVLSSTQIREAVKQCRPIDGMVAPAVAEYIRTRGLYQ